MGKMEKINKTVGKSVAQMKNLQPSYKNTSTDLKKYNEQEAKNIERRIKRSETGEFSLSKYSPGNLEPELMIKQINKAKCAFPANPPEFWNVLMDRLIEKVFKKERLGDAVDYVIDTC